MERWRGKTAVVTGAASGIGYGIAQGLAEAGMRVVGLDINKHAGEEMRSKVTGEGSIVSRLCDVSKPEEIAATFKWIEENCGGIHVLVNCAGVLYQGQITEAGPNTLTEDQIIASLDTNIRGPILCTRNAVACMKRNGFDGHIININSLAGHYVPFSPSMNVYGSTKYAITAFTSALNQELAEFNNKIKVTSISPGLTDTRMAAHLGERASLALRPADLAGAALYALSSPPHVNVSELTITSVLEKRL